MNYRIEKDNNAPAYIQLYEQLRRDIVSGTYGYKTKLPSKRLIAEELGISIITVEHAYDILRDEGYVEPRERSGYFVVFRKNDFFSVSESPVGHTAMIKNEPYATSFPFSAYAKTMRRVISDYGEEIMIKSENFGCHQLRNAISSYLRRSRGIIVSPGNIIVGAGAEYLYGLIVQLLGRNRIYAAENPSYNMIEKVYKSNAVKCELLNLGNDGVLSEELKSTKASVLHITPYRSFPSGVTASASKRAEYIRWADSEDNRVVVEDDYESEFTPSTKPEETLFRLASKQNVIYLNTFSKTIAPSMRAGYMLLPDRLMESFTERAGFYSCTVPTFEQLVLAELIGSGEYERHINRVRHRRRVENAK